MAVTPESCSNSGWDLDEVGLVPAQGNQRH
jgi:hypothetical protein